MTDVEAQISADEALARRIQVRRVTCSGETDGANRRKLPAVTGKVDVARHEPVQPPSLRCERRASWVAGLIAPLCDEAAMKSSLLC